MFNTSKLKMLAELFDRAGFRFVSIEQHLGVKSVKVLIEAYPSYYFVKSGQWFRHDVAYPGASAPVEVPDPMPLNVRAHQSPGVVWVMAIGFSIDQLRRRIFPVTVADFANRPDDWTAEIGAKNLTILNFRMELIDAVAQGSKEPDVRLMAKAILATQIGQIAEHQPASAE